MTTETAKGEEPFPLLSPAPKNPYEKKLGGQNLGQFSQKNYERLKPYSTDFLKKLTYYGLLRKPVRQGFAPHPTGASPLTPQKRKIKKPYERKIFYFISFILILENDNIIIFPRFIILSVILILSGKRGKQKK